MNKTFAAMMIAGLVAGSVSMASESKTVKKKTTHTEEHKKDAKHECTGKEGCDGKEKHESKTETKTEEVKKTH